MGKTVVATISQSIAAIRLIMRLEGWLQKREARPAPAQPQSLQSLLIPTISTIPNRYPSLFSNPFSLEEKGEAFSARAKPYNYKTFLSYDQTP